MINRESEKGAGDKEKVEEKGRKASEFVNQAEEKVDDTAKKLNEQFDEYSQTISEYVKNCPIKSVMTASAIGLLLGLLIKK